MSADNGIYILCTLAKGGRHEYRVRHLQAVEDYMWDTKAGQESGSANVHIRNARKMWAGCKVFKQRTSALKEADKLYQEIMNDDFCPICEYGISCITIDRVF